jgi:ParB family chromosome partitioning protein
MSSQPPDRPKDESSGAVVKTGKRALGRGLDALLGADLAPAAAASNDIAVEIKPDDKILKIPMERISPNPYQPRKTYNDQALAALAASIAAHGIMQPLVVRRQDNGYQLIAGERRLRAAQQAGLLLAPVIVREASDEQALLLALLENLQREDLNPMEEAKAFQRLVDEFQLSHENIAESVGKDRSTVSNTLRLLNLPDLIQDDIIQGRLSQGHARALLALDNEAQMRSARDRVIAGGLNVRAAEQLVKSMLKPYSPRPAPIAENEAYWRDLVASLQQEIGAKVEIRRQGNKGQVVLHYYSHDDLQRLLDLLNRKKK